MTTASTSETAGQTPVDVTPDRIALDLILSRCHSWPTIQAILEDPRIDPTVRIAVARAAIRSLPERHGQVIALAHEILRQLAPSGE